jgi:AAA15 family ATPase/GTPase
MLEDLEISKLGRVNLIVGKNNSGKSTILEALRLYANNAQLSLLHEILMEHDEAFDIDQSSNKKQNWYGLKNIFTNRELPLNSNTFISISANNESPLKIEYIFYYTKEETETDEDGDVFVTRRRIFVTPSEIDIQETDPLTSAIRLSSGGRSAIIDLADDIKKPQFYPNMLWGFPDKTKTLLNCSYVPTTFITREVLASLWDEVALTPNEDVVIKSLSIIDNNIDRLAFIEDSNQDNRIPIVKLKELDKRIPLNSMGDGISRVLQLILSVFRAENGILLIDEFENGLHYSVQEQVWQIIFQLATNLNIQVFATTHSWDCIESFTKVAVESPEEGVLLKVSKSARTSHNGKSIVTIYDEEALKTITATDLEVR